LDLFDVGCDAFWQQCSPALVLDHPFPDFGRGALVPLVVRDGLNREVGLDEEPPRQRFVRVDDAELGHQRADVGDPDSVDFEVRDGDDEEPRRVSARLVERHPNHRYPLARRERVPQSMTLERAADHDDDLGGVPQNVVDSLKMPQMEWLETPRIQGSLEPFFCLRRAAHSSPSPKAYLTCRVQDLFLLQERTCAPKQRKNCAPNQMGSLCIVTQIRPVLAPNVRQNLKTDVTQIK